MIFVDQEIFDVFKFHVKFRQILSAVPSFLTRRKAAERANFMLEELTEYGVAAGLTLQYDYGSHKFKFVPDATLVPDMALQSDALIDLTYVAKGTGVMMGLPWYPLWKDVQRANMAKELGVTPRALANPGQYLMDVGKPPGWEPPNTDAILADAGFTPGAFQTDGAHDEAKCLEDAIYREPTNAV